jgi:hypothetical protein
MDPNFLDLSILGGEWSAACPSHFITGEKGTSTHWTGGWVGPRAGLDNMETRKFLILPGLGTPTPQ